MTTRPWETEPDSLEFEAEGLPCVMLRGGMGVWCGYVGVGPAHPLYGLPTNHPLKLPSSWFDGRRGFEGTGPIDLFIHALGGKELLDACAISMAFQVHGGCNWAEDHVPDREPDGRWWFGFDCGHAGDYAPELPVSVAEITGQIIDSMPDHVRATMRKIMTETAAQTGDYRDQQYVVSECQSLASQLINIVKILSPLQTQREKSGMPVLMIGAAERAKIADAIANAEANPIPLDTVLSAAMPDKDTIKLEDRPPDFKRPESQHVEFPGGYRASLSIEEQPPGLCSHLSVSVFGRAKKGVMPSPQAVAMIAEEFGVPFPPDKGWTEEFDPGEFAINLVSLYAPTPEGNA